ncbi:hypothetical protein G5I_02880 [Acromyrmex echinatior]|uniref:Uncharacterized protein n=1 Tax=Acromyrmex echinatior TaxID=103372 RepID=F4WBG8_ACREC|nr:hypothetical protein G5I_02880 [Acromyrmex echinatior]
MAENSFRRKTRSASICAPGFSSMEQMLEAMPPSGARERERGERERDSGSGTPDGSTPTRRRRPATRSQSARVSGGNKSIRRRAAAQDDVRSFLKEQSVSISHRQTPAAHHHHHHHEGASMKSAHCSSEPRLTENDVSPGIRRRGSRRGQSMHYSHQRKSNAFLDVPDVSSQMPPREEGEDEDSYRLRSFSLTSKGQK